MVFKVKDFYFKKAKKENYLARSIYKLEEINLKYKILNKGDDVLDLGYSPGSWMQYTSQYIGPKGSVTGIDLKRISERVEQLKNVRLFEMDVFEIEDLEKIGANRPFNLVLSDMAPNTMGVKSVDQARSLNLVEKVFELLPLILREGGHIVIKVFESNDARMFLKKEKDNFNKFCYFRPKSTRSVSKEFFAIGKGYCPSR